MISIATTVEITVKADQGRAFTHIVPIDLTSIFTGFGPLPAVVRTQDQSGGWDAAGQTRTVLLSDGRSARELLNSYESPNHFSYTAVTSQASSAILRFRLTANGGSLKAILDTQPSDGDTRSMQNPNLSCPSYGLLQIFSGVATCVRP